MSATMSVRAKARVKALKDAAAMLYAKADEAGRRAEYRDADGDEAGVEVARSMESTLRWAGDLVASMTEDDR